MFPPKPEMCYIRRIMAIDISLIQKLERELDNARRQLLTEDGERYRIVMREIKDEERQRIFDTLTDKRDRRLFGLEAPEEPVSAKRAGASGGDLECPICHKAGLTTRGLALHKVRMHKDQ
jgi:hypothetical protein